MMVTTTREASTAQVAFRQVEIDGQTVLLPMFVPVGADGEGPASADNPGAVAVRDGFLTVSASFTRPADTTAYAAGDRVAPTGGAVLELLNVARAAGEAVRIERARLRKSGAVLTNASFRIHLFRTLPTVSAADNAQFNNLGVLAVADIAGYIGTFEATMNYAGTAGARGVGLPTIGAGVTCEAAGMEDHETSLWAVIEATAAYTPASEEVFTLTLEGARS